MNELEQLRARCAELQEQVDLQVPLSALKQQASRIAELEAQLAEIGKQEPVAWRDEQGVIWQCVDSILSSDTPLYAHAPDSDARIKKLEAENAELLKQCQQWQPIETAPKDGTTFDIWVKSYKNESYGVRMTNVYYNNGVICGRRYPNSSFGEYATHWMPPPDAPAIKAAKGGAK